MKKSGNSNLSSIREWVKSLFIAVSLATAIKWFIAEHFMVPTSSMVPCLLPGDHLVVAKLGYGPRVPVTPLQFPLTHKTIFGFKSYSDAIKLKPFRLFSLSKVKRGDVVVFNYPAEIDCPLDIREFYVKRCVGLPGDIIKVKNFIVYINGIKEKICNEVQIRFFFKEDSVITEKEFNNVDIYEFYPYNYGMTGYIVHASRNSLKKMQASRKNLNSFIVGGYDTNKHDYFFGKEFAYEWDCENLGPIEIPYKSFKININRTNLQLYGFSILHHEDLKNVKIVDDQLFIDDISVDAYIFTKDYYFMMGDNRCNSKDSRFWGFVPEDHIVGKPLCVLFSRNLESKSIFVDLRWDRFFELIR